MDAVNELKNEHEAVRLTLKILGKITEQTVAAGKISAADDLEALFDFFMTFVDRCHHGKEESLLFPALEEVGISRQGGPIGVMLSEHQQGRDLVARMKKILKQDKKGKENVIDDFKKTADAYIRLLNDHIDKENNVLFPIALQTLSKIRLAELKKGFDRIETDSVGQGKHQAFHRMIEELEAGYLA